MPDASVTSSLDRLRQTVREAAREGDERGFLPLTEVPFYEKLTEGGHQYGVRQEADWNEFARTLLNSLQHEPELHAPTCCVRSSRGCMGGGGFDEVTERLKSSRLSTCVGLDSIASTMRPHSRPRRNGCRTSSKLARSSGAW